MSLIVIIDYGSSNLFSATKAFELAANEINHTSKILVTNDPEQVIRADHIVLPGVGTFANCKRSLYVIPGMIEALTEIVINKGRPFLGICVGMQLMATCGFEHGNMNGLGWIKGNVTMITPLDLTLKVPHMGWNELQFSAKRHAVLTGLAPKSHAYFIHSYHFVANRSDDILATIDYGEPLTAVVGHDNLIGVQFHPEKSQSVGLALIVNFLMWRP
ncbi:MAG: imidazole glycerol phosphate synthase subunit HisH [Rhodospirillaceae bacterium]|jgi:glutamine amidotransferase|nr:imidazole glycerol phosphate synthase subunit HisH [Rhodospirillaceae bacterium]